MELKCWIEMILVREMKRMVEEIGSCCGSDQVLRDLRRVVEVMEEECLVEEMRNEHKACGCSGFLEPSHMKQVG